MRKNRILIIGGGRRGLATIEILSEYDNIEIVAVVDIDNNASGMKLAERLGLQTDAEWLPYIKPADNIDAVLNLTDNKNIDVQLQKMSSEYKFEVAGELTSRILSELLMERQVQVELHRVSERITSNIGLDELMVLILSSCVKSTKAEAGLIILRDEDNSKWEIKSNWGFKEDVIDTVYKHIVRNIDSLDAKSEETAANDIKISDSVTGVEIYSLITALKTRDRVIGAILVSKDIQSGIFPNNSKRLLSTFANHSTVAIENTLLYKQTQKLSITDGLTGLYNHRYFQERIKIELSRAQRYDLNFSLILIDIDNFKDINDTFGHITGDEVIKKLAGYLRNTVRESDIVARYGGDEFIVLLPETPKEGALIVAERIREYIAENKIAENIATHTSIGVSSYPDDGVFAHDIIDKADKALYRAKEEGRNRTCAA